MSAIVAVSACNEDGNNHALRKLAFDDTLVQQLEDGDSERIGVKVVALDGSPERKAAMQPADRSEGPPTTRKGQVPMSRARYDALATTLHDRRTSREKAHAAMRRDIANCMMMVKRLEEEEQPRVLTESEDSYEWLLSCLDGSPTVRDYFVDLTSPPRSLPSVQSLHASSPTAAVKALSPIFDRAAALEARCEKQKSLKALQHDLSYERERARLRSESIDDELADVVKSIEAAEHHMRRAASDVESRLQQLAQRPSLTALEADKVQSARLLQSTHNRLVTQEQSLKTAQEQLLNDEAKCAALLGVLQREQINVATAQRELLIAQDEPEARAAVLASEQRHFAALIETCMQRLLEMRTASIDRQLERHLEQRNELRRLAAMDNVGSGDDGCSAATTVAELRHQRSAVTAEVRSVNAEILRMEEAIGDFSAHGTDGAGCAIHVDAAALTACLSDVAAKEMLLEQKRALVDDAVRTHQERCAVDRWLENEAKPPGPTDGGVLAPETAGAASWVLHDIASVPPEEDPMPILNAYRTLRRQCLLLGKELSNVNEQQQRQQHFTSLGLYHTLHRELGDAAARSKALEEERCSLEADIAALKDSELLTQQHRASLILQENEKMRGIDELRVIEADVLSRHAAMEKQLADHEVRRRSFRAEEAEHMQRRQRRYLECMGILEQPVDDTPGTALPVATAPATGGGRFAQQRSREQVLAAITRPQWAANEENARKEVGHTVVAVDSTPGATTDGKINPGRWWWPFGPHAARRTEHRGPSTV